MYYMKTMVLLLVIGTKISVSLGSPGDDGGGGDNDSNIYVEIDSRLLPISCNSRHMSSYVENGKRYCKCDDGYFLNPRNKFDVTNARCDPCTDCSKDEAYPYLIEPCGKTSNSLCCKNANMISQVSKDGILECGTLLTSKTTERIEKSEDWSKTFDVKHLKCDKIRHYEPYIDEDGTEGCRCVSGFFLQQRNIHDATSIRCMSCTDCSQHEDRPYQVQACTKDYDSVCCPDKNMVAEEKERNSWNFECASPVNDKTEKKTTNNPVVTKIKENELPSCDPPGMKWEKDTQQCLCDNGDPAVNQNGVYICDRKGSWIAPRVPFFPVADWTNPLIFWVITLAMAVASIYLCWTLLAKVDEEHPVMDILQQPRRVFMYVREFVCGDPKTDDGTRQRTDGNPNPTMEFEKIPLTGDISENVSDGEQDPDKVVN